MNRDEIITAVRQYAEGREEIECRFISTYSEDEIFILASNATSPEEAVELVLAHSRNNSCTFVR
jgi:hypothetical protein